MLEQDGPDIDPLDDQQPHVGPRVGRQAGPYLGLVVGLDDEQRPAAVGQRPAEANEALVGADASMNAGVLVPLALVLGASGTSPTPDRAVG